MQYEFSWNSCTYIPYVIYRLWDNKFTESGKTKLHQAEEERKQLTGLTFSLGI